MLIKMAGERFNVNESLESVGRFGKWRFVELGLINLIKYISTCIVCPSLAIVFIGAQPRHHCWIPEGNKPNESIPMVTKDGVTDLDKCNVYKNFSSVSNETEPCPLGWYYDTEVPGNTIVSEWGLVCERSVLTETSQMVLVAGVMVGSVVGSLLADAFGRKVTFLASVVLISIITFITAWVDNYYLFVVLRFFTGVLQQAIVLPGFVLSCELFPASDRTVAGLMIQNFWAVGMWILALFAYLLKDWRHLLIFCSFPGVIAVPAFWLISESIPWLVAKGRIRDAKKILEKAARWNNVELPEKYRLTEEEEQLLKIIDDSKEEGRGRKKTLNVIFKGFKNPKADKTQDSNVATYTVLDIFKSCRLTTFALMMCFVWCTSALVYYGLSLNTGSLAGDPYMNFFYSGLVEIPAYTISAIVLQLIGRRWPIFVFHIIAGVALFITIFIKNETALVTLAMIGKFGISGCFGSVFLWAPELFPTTLRNVGIGIASLGGRVGNIVAPYTPFISRVIPWLPNVVFGVMCLIAAVFTLLLPETLGRPLPQTIEEVERWTRTLSPEEKRRYKEAKKLAKQRRQQEQLARQNGPSSKPLTENGEAN